MDRLLDHKELAHGLPALHGAAHAMYGLACTGACDGGLQCRLSVIGWFDTGTHVFLDDRGRWQAYDVRRFAPPILIQNTGCS